MTKKPRGPYRKSLQPSLSSEQLEDLQTAFESVNRHFECPLCKTLSLFHKHGYSTHDPTQPLFVCKTCKRQSTAHEIYHILCGTHSMVPDTQVTSEPSTSFQNPTIHDSRDAELINKLLKQVEQLTAQLNQSQEKIAELTAIIASNHKNSNIQITTDNDFPSLHNEVPQIIDESISQAPWRDPAKVAALKQSLYLNRQKNRVRKEETAIRFFQPPSTNQGFKYLFVSTKARIPVGKLRTYLRNMGINNARVLDIHYPDRNVAALLVHNDYVSEFKETLEAKRIHFMDEFNPWSGSTLKDPKYKDLTEQEKNEKAHEIQQQRLQRAVYRIREPVKFAVAHYFYQQQWLSKSFIDNLNETRYGLPQDIFEMDDDMDEISDIETTPNVTHPNNSQQ